jgi:hypothetical protein
MALTRIIAESETVFQERALEIAQNFFDVSSTSQLKIGSFGYVTGLASHIMRDSTFHRDMLYNEFFLVSASLNSTLYNWAKTLDYPINLATPSRFPVAIKFPISSIEAAATLTSSGISRVFNIPRTTKFDVGGYSFMLPYDVNILFTRGANNQLSITGTYDFSITNYSDSSITTPYLKTMLTTENGIAYATIAVTLFQLDYKQWIFNIASNDSLDAGIIEQNYGSNLVSFNSFYNPNTVSNNSYTPLEMIFNEVSLPTTNQYCYYTLISDDTIRLYFSNAANDFRPAYNSKVGIETFTTLAEGGNFTYSGAISMQGTLSALPFTVANISSAATGGVSISSFNDTRIALMEKLRTRDSYITSYDLESFFKTNRKKNFTTNTDFSVVKLRDDIFRRQYTVYINQRNANNEVVPTNTVDLKLSIDDIVNMDYRIKPGTLVIYDRTLGRYRILQDSELPEVYLTSSDQYLYSVPLLLNFDFKEFPKVVPYLTNYSKDSALTYHSYNTQIPYEIVINTLTLTRDTLNNPDYFALTCDLNTSAVNLDDILIRAVLMQDNKIIGYADMQRGANTSSYSLAIQTSDKFDSDGYFLLENSFKNIADGSVQSTTAINGGYNVRLAVLIKNSAINSEVTNALYDNMPDLQNYTLVAELDTQDTFTFAEDLSEIMYYGLDIRQATGEITIKKVPLVGSLFYLNDYQNAQIMNDFYQNLMVAKNMSDQLENNTSIDVKYFNTCGISRYFESDTIDLRFKLSMALNVSPNKTLTNSIKNSIVSFIEACNDASDKQFAFSNLIKKLETDYQEIKYIKFFSINGANIQSITQTQYLDTVTEQLPLDYVPEYLTVRKILPTDATLSDFDYDIQIDFI